MMSLIFITAKLAENDTARKVVGSMVRLSKSCDMDCENCVFHSKGNMKRAANTLKNRMG